MNNANPENISCVYYYLLLILFFHLQDSPTHIYVEVILRGETEGQFLEDPRAHRRETMKDVSRLGGFVWCGQMKS